MQPRNDDPKKKLRGSVTAIALTVLAGGLMGCGAGPQEAKRGGTPGSDTIVVASQTDINDVNELTANASPIHATLHQYALFLPLLEEMPNYAEGPPTFEPRLAKSWELSEDRSVLTFHLRHDVVWSDGVPVTAEDVRWTWEVQTDPDFAWAFAYVKEFITDVEVVDEHTVAFHFSKGYANQVLDAIMGVTLPKHAWSRLPVTEWRENVEWFRENLVVDGPFTLESWEPQQRFVLRRNERYYEPDKPRAERIVFRVVPDRANQLAMLRSGEAHMIDWARPDDAASIEADPELELLSYIPRTFQGIVWNVKNPLFASKKVRQALTLAIDRQVIVDSPNYGYAEIGVSPYTSNLWVRNHELKPWPYDPARAQALLAEEGWIDADGDGVLDKDGKPFRFEILTGLGNELRQDALTIVQEQLRQVGIVAEQQVVEFNTMLSRELQHDFEASFVGLSIPTNLDLYYFFHTEAANGSYNFGSFSNPEVDKLIETIQGEVDLLAAKPLFDALQALLHEEVPLTFLYESQRLIPIRKELRGVQPNALNTFFGLQDWELAADGS